MQVQEVELLGLHEHVDVADQVDRRGDDPETAVVAHRIGAAGKEVARARLVLGEHRRRLAQQVVQRRALGEVVGRVDIEEILDEVFRSFCIGK